MEGGAALHPRLQQLLEMNQRVLQGQSQVLRVGLLAAVEGSDGEVDVVGLRVVADSVAIRNQGPKTHHAVRVSRHLVERQQRSRQENNPHVIRVWMGFGENLSNKLLFSPKITSEDAAIFSEKKEDYCVLRKSRQSF